MAPGNLNDMFCLDIYLLALGEKEYKTIRHKIRSLDYTPHPLLSADLCMQQQQQLSSPVNGKDVRMLHKLQKKYQWTIDLQKLLAIPHQVIVLTNPALAIEWVNTGFTKMTGYAAVFVSGKTPKILQGINTSEETRKRIRHNLQAGQPFTETLINYRNNKEEYLCRVNVFPIHNQHYQLTHFLALESEVI